MNLKTFQNPFKPGAGHMPPYLAGREIEKDKFLKLLEQQVILNNLVLTGLRGVGKTVLLEQFKQLAIKEGWLWVGTDLSESSSLTEETMAIRLITDISIITADFVVAKREIPKIGFKTTPGKQVYKLNYNFMLQYYHSAQGLVADKIKSLLNVVWQTLKSVNIKGVIFAYDEAQTMSDHKLKELYPLSMFLQVFQSIQKQNIPFMLVMAGLPTLFPKLVEARTYSERMFTTLFLNRLNHEACHEAILKPITDAKCPVKFNAEAIDVITNFSGGYPYFIQFICKEIYDSFLQRIKANQDPTIPMNEIIHKLDRDFFAARWDKVTERQRDLLSIIASLNQNDAEFTGQEIVDASKSSKTRAFGGSQVNQLLNSLTSIGLIFKNKHGKYMFAVPLLGQFIQRREAQALNEKTGEQFF